MKDKMLRLTLAQLFEYATKIGIKPEDMIIMAWEDGIAANFKSRNGVEIVDAQQVFEVIYGQ